jgi:cell division protein FtsB
MRIERTFSIEYDDELGPLWMNKDNLLMCLNTNAFCAEGLIVAVEDDTEYVAELEAQFAIVVERNEVLEAVCSLLKDGIDHVLLKPYEPEKKAAP